jgi:hypothetical protein
MNARVTGWTICVVLSLGSVSLFGQQAAFGRKTMLSPCSVQVGIRLAVIARNCKPVLAGMQEGQLSNNPAHNDNGGTYVTFDAPGAVNGTLAFAINPAGAVTGYGSDVNFNGIGFVRDRSGNLTTFAVPGAGGGTYPSAISDTGAITGQWCDATYVLCPGFVRDSQGDITTFDVPGEVFGVYPFAISPQGAITGTYLDENFAFHGFLRASNGSIMTIDAPGAGTTFPQGTQAFAINANGTIAGCYTDTSSVGHGYERDSNGTITEFDVPDSTKLSCEDDYGFFNIPSLLEGMNPAGAITGAYFEPIVGNPFGGNYRGFLRNRDGSFATFDAVPSPSSPCCTWTFSIAINPAGQVVGWDNDYSSVNHGFVRTQDGTVTILDAPGAGTGFNQGTLARGINPGGQIAGFYTDGSGLSHGFVRIPH